MLKLVGSLLLGLVLVGCGGMAGGNDGRPGGSEIAIPGGAYQVYTWHDSAKGVTCWILSVSSTYGGRGGISCLYDK